MIARMATIFDLKINDHFHDMALMTIVFDLKINDYFHDMALMTIIFDLKINDVTPVFNSDEELMIFIDHKHDYTYFINNLAHCSNLCIFY